jgi:uncharacterized protein YyaL (SSP411 family)
MTKNRIQKSLATKNNSWLNKSFQNCTCLNLPGLVGLKNCVNKHPITPSNRLQNPSIRSPTHILKQTVLLLITLFVLIHPLLGNASTSTTTPSSTNILAQSPSPYLAMHGHDPVKWHSWNAEVLKQAQIANKPLFISSGYFSCHWCHVMQRENYHNLETAAYLNKHFISVKIDRELNPEIDKVLIEFAQKATGQAGWPQHVVLTPEGYPFASFIYLPNTVFNNTLQRIVELWEKQPNKIRALAQQSVEPVKTPQAYKVTQRDFTGQLLQQIERAKDDFSGGLKSSASKFPQAPLLQALLRMKNLPEPIEEWLLLTLDQMQSQHLFDHIHGGFYRYTIDPEWQIPHFEKMAYTNALLADLYLQASQRFNRPDYLQTALATLNHLQEQLYNPATQLYQSSQSAIDAHSKEGGDYLWTKSRLQQKLTKQEYSAIDQAWSLSKPAPYDLLGWHPSPLVGKKSDLWPAIRLKLQTNPLQIPIDSKSILGWNGLILSALSRAYAVAKDTTYLKQATRLATVLMNQIQQENPPRALSVTGDKMGEANLQDYAFIYQGITDWQKLTEQTNYQSEISQLEQTITQRFYTKSGWQYHQAPLLPGQQGEWLMADNAIPSPSAFVSCLKPESVDFAGKALLANPLSYASYLKTLECIQRHQPTPNNVE